MIAATSNGTLVLGLIISVVLGVILMQAAAAFKRKWGRPPWGVPPWAWLIIGLLFEVIGAVIYLIAYLTSQARYVRNAGMGSTYGSAPPPYPPPAYPPPQAPQAPQTGAPPSIGPSSSPADESATSPPSETPEEPPA